MPKKTSVTSAVVLQVLRWPRPAARAFSPGRRNAATAGGTAALTPDRPAFCGSIPRTIHAALSAERAQRGMTWKQVADELPGFTESMLTTISQQVL